MAEMLAKSSPQSLSCELWQENSLQHFTTTPTDADALSLIWTSSLNRCVALGSSLCSTNGIVMRVNALPLPPGKRQLADTNGRVHICSTLYALVPRVVCVYDQLLPCALSFLADVIDRNRNGGALEYIKQKRSCCLTVVEMALVSSKQGKCTPDCLSLARPRLTKQEWNTNVSVTNHFLVGSSHHTASHGSETCNGVIGYECFCCRIQVLHGSAIIKWVLN